MEHSPPTARPLRPPAPGHDQLPAARPPPSALAIESLLGRTSARRLDLEELEAALMARGIGADFCDALTRLGHPPSAEAAQRRSDRTRAQEARAALHDVNRCLGRALGC